MKNHGGLITKADLANYKAVERTPVSGEYRGYQVFSMPPPSSGGIHIVQILNILENFDIHKYGFGSADAMQVMAEAESTPMLTARNTLAIRTSSKCRGRR